MRNGSKRSKNNTNEKLNFQIPNVDFENGVEMVFYKDFLVWAGKACDRLTKLDPELIFFQVPFALKRF